ncbi:uncharacterized protein LOC115581185 isoform X2 [Sparus aurata]|uniref:uncharacterized protein LOC115581185 isoform X2 n=1 Tax=Sparus aurata TaxID=8175 RepID=UPI0011C0E59C|nr:uncharacterized protein LOC115581185 isoform X2 [Sparus aurata]
MPCVLPQCSLSFCSNNISVSKVVDSLEKLRKVTFPSRDAVLHAYLHFEALTSHDYSYSCACCGYHPPVVVMDLHKKGVFNLPVSDIREVPENFTGEVDIEEFWDSVQLEMIARAFFPSRAKNIFAVHPSFEHWAPWIGKNTRTDTVLNSEFEKVSHSKSSAEAELSIVSEDRLTDELMKQKVSTVRKLCKACNLDDKGSRMDLLTRLRDEMKNRHTYDKIFQKIWGASGGWSVILCPHGVVYSLKFNLRAESPRDFTDLLLSWKHLPNVSVYDFARGLATHANLRVPTTLPFKPHEGRLAAPTQDNVKAAQLGKLDIPLPWLTEKLQNPDKDGHPCTGSSDHYALYDKFHEANTSDPREVLRRINLVPELQGSLNSQVAEQLFSSLQKNNYFLNNMAPSTHIFVMRNLVHHRNSNTNGKLLKKQLKRGHESHTLHDIVLNEVGQAVLAPGVLPSEKSAQHQPSPVGAPQQGLCADTHRDDDTCGPHCANITKCENVQPCRASWTVHPHPSQQQLLDYVLDTEKPESELIVKTKKSCLTRGDFWTLGLKLEMESTIGNACFELIEKIAQSKGKCIFVVDLYAVPTWRQPTACDPLRSLPRDVHIRDSIVIPVWKSGHYLLSDNLEAKIISDCRKSAEWLEKNQHLFSSKVELPSAVGMGEEEMAEAAKQYAILWSEDDCFNLEDPEKDDLREPFKFKFSQVEDMWFFCGEICDKQGYLAYAECEIEQ